MSKINIAKEKIKSLKLARFLKWKFVYQKRLPMMVELELDSRPLKSRY